MNNQLLLRRINEIQHQYYELLKEVVPMMESEDYISVALDSITVFWRKNRSVIELFLEYVLKEKNVVFYTGATYFDVEHGDQYSFLLLGDMHIFDDPLGKFCELCHHGDCPKAFSDSVLHCAKDNIAIFEKCEGLITVLPLRLMRYEKEKKAFLDVGDSVFLSLFDDIPNMETYFEKCNSIDGIINSFHKEYQNAIRLCEDDNPQNDFRTRIEHASEELKASLAEDIPIEKSFFLCLYGPLQQAVDILSVTIQYDATPLIRYPVAYHNVLLLLPNFVEQDAFLSKTRRIIILNTLYNLFDKTKYINESLSSFYKSVTSFGFEEKAIRCFRESDKNSTIDNVRILIGQFDKWRETSEDI